VKKQRSPAAGSVSAQIATFAHGRVPRALRRQQVLEQAYELFVERCYDGASMDELARRVGVTKPVIYELVGSKEQLFREVVAGIQAELATAVATAVSSETDLAGRLHAGILAFLRFAERKRRGWAALMSMGAGGGAITATLRREPVALVAALIGASAGRDGGASPDARTLEILAQAINGAVEFVALWWQSHPDTTAESLAASLAALLSPGLVAMVTPREPSRRRAPPGRT
jgi:AcrR family transcriptional regulator